MPRTPWPPRVWALKWSSFDTLAVPGVGDDEQVHSLARHVARHDLVARTQPHSPDPGRAAAHGPDLGLCETNGDAALAHHQQVVVSAGPDDTYELVSLVQVDGDEALAARLVVLREGGLLHLTGLGRKDEVLIGIERPCLDDGLDALDRLERQEVDDRRSPGVALLHGDLVSPQPVDLPAIGEQQQVGVRRRVEDLVDEILLLQPRPLHPAPAARLSAEGIGLDGLDVAGSGQRDDESPRPR